MLYPVTLSNASAYYLGVTNQANATCGYNITARLDGAFLAPIALMRAFPIIRVKVTCR
jgi:hypothetical protein